MISKLTVTFMSTLDLLMEKLSKTHDVTRIKAIGGAAQVRTPRLSSLTND